jgi:hypothetical protein
VKCGSRLEQLAIIALIVETRWSDRTGHKFSRYRRRVALVVVVSADAQHWTMIPGPRLERLIAAVGNELQVRLTPASQDGFVQPVADAITPETCVRRRARI